LNDQGFVLMSLPNASHLTVVASLMAGRFPYQSKGLFVLGLSIDKEAQLAKSYLQKKNYTFASTWASPQVLQKIKKPNGLPVTLVYGRDGKLLQAEKGQMFAEDISAISSWL
ncbi:MAG: hypothetical protein EBT78_10130, partial [Betaproteobacteria bacterium]|nr:hypothetical protein [Betaproteobacteria bacterium]